jgi:WD40 repeat protein/Flp pilus assembly protein TadD
MKPGSSDTWIKVWDVPRGRSVATTAKLPGGVIALGLWFSPDSRLVAAAASDRAVRVLEAGTGKFIAQLAHGGVALDAAFSPDGRRVVSAGTDSAAKLWELESGRMIAELRHANVVQRVAFTADGRHLLTAGADNTARVWDALTGAAAGPPLRHGDRVTRAEFSPDGRLVLTASAEQAVRIWDLATGHLAIPPLEHAAPLRHAAFDATGDSILTAGDDRAARVWDAATGRARTRPVRHEYPVRYAVLGPDGTLVTASEAAQGGAVCVWKLATAEVIHRQPTSPLDAALSQQVQETAARFVQRQTPEGLILSENPILGQALNLMALLGPLQPAPPAAPRAQGWPRAWFSPDGRHVLVAEDRGAARVYEAATLRPVSDAWAHAAAVMNASFSADGRFVLTETFLPDDTLRVWEMATGKLVASLVRWAAPFAAREAALSPDGSRLLLVGDGVARVHDVGAGRDEARLQKPGTRVVRAAFSPDGTRVVTVSDDKTAQLWEAATGTLVPTPAQIRYGYGKQFWPPTFSPDGRLLALATPDGVRVWDTATGDPVTPPLRLPDGAASAAFSPGGDRLLTAGDDGAARVWSLAAADRDAGAFLQMAEVLGCVRAQPGGGTAPLAPDELRSAWSAWHSGSPKDLTAPASDVAAWHAEAARTCEKARQYEGALVHLERVAAQDPDEPNIEDRRGRACAQLARWPEAAAHFEQATLRGHDQAGPWYRHALLRLHLKDHSGYQRACAAALERFGAAPDLVAVQLAAWTCVLGVAAKDDAVRALAAAQRAALAEPKNHARLLTVGAALYRAGRFDDAVRKLDESTKVWGKDDTVWDWLFLAMSHHRLGQHRLAEGYWTKASRWMDQAGGRTPATALSWSNQMELSLLRREAEALLDGKNP